MDIQFYNSLTNQVEKFHTLEPGIVRMYNCGPTVYDYAHIGNFRSFLFADVLRRFLEFTGYKVDQVMNLTDVGHMTEDQLADGGGEDKMEAAAKRLKEAKKQGQAPVDNPSDPFQVAEYYIDAFVSDAKLLNMRVADEYPQKMPRATENIDRMIKMVGQLIERDHAYVADDGAVYFDVQSFPSYGCLSGNTLDNVISGAGGRVQEEHQTGKRHAADFLLWKADPRHLMRWPSPWGEGYPGWHIECSAMAMGLLDTPTLDIHTGGEDNIFPHHECEIAQSTGATGEPFAKYWMHARHLFVEGEKMSKSKGNFFTVRELFGKGVDPAVLRYELIRAHYRSNLNFTFKGLEDSEKSVRRIREFAAKGPAETVEAPVELTEVEQEFADALADDLNMSGALGILFKWMSTATPDAANVAVLRRIDSVLGVIEAHDVQSDTGSDDGVSDASIDAMCKQIDEARVNKDYAESDRIRDELIAAGIEVQIKKDGTTWRRKMQLG